MVLLIPANTLLPVVLKLAREGRSLRSEHIPKQTEEEGEGEEKKGEEEEGEEGLQGAAVDFWFLQRCVAAFCDTAVKLHQEYE